MPGGDLFNPISELRLLGHFASIVRQLQLTVEELPVPKYSAISGNVRSQHRFTSYIATFPE
jgi:hypothetical protein